MGEIPMDKATEAANRASKPRCRNPNASSNQPQTYPGMKRKSGNSKNAATAPNTSESMKFGLTIDI